MGKSTLTNQIIEIADKTAIGKLANFRVMQQMDDWGDEFEDHDDLYGRTLHYLADHINKDIFIFYIKDDVRIVSTCGVQIINLLPQCNDNGRIGFICDAFTLAQYRQRGYMYNLLKRIQSYAKENKLCELWIETDNNAMVNICNKLGFHHDTLRMVKGVSL